MAESRGLSPAAAIELKDRITNAGFDLQFHEVKPLNMNHSDKAGLLYW